MQQAIMEEVEKAVDKEWETTRALAVEASGLADLDATLGAFVDKEYHQVAGELQSASREELKQRKVTSLPFERSPRRKPQPLRRSRLLLRRRFPLPRTRR